MAVIRWILLRKKILTDTKLTSLVPVLGRTQFIWIILTHCRQNCTPFSVKKLNSVCTYIIMLRTRNDYCLNNISVWRYYKKPLLVSDNKKPYFYFSIMMFHINTAHTTHVQFMKYQNILKISFFLFIFINYTLWLVPSYCKTGYI